MRTDTPDIGARTRRRVMWRLMPFLILLHVVAYLVQVNVSYSVAYLFGLIASNGLICWLPKMMKSLSGCSPFTLAHLALALMGLCVAVIGLTGYTPSFWAYATSFLGGTANAAAIGLINSIGNLGSFAGPYAMGWLKVRASDYIAGVYLLAASSILTAILVLAAKSTWKRRPLPVAALQPTPWS